ncbi:iron chelate uptake ABC transporter family permease subunit [bacterium]|nr:iron chelate uptake ABC transporter family permease subunit [bacterium]
MYQGLLRNPLADPYILGTSSAGTFGALVAAILNYHFNITVYIFSIGAAFLSMLLVYRIFFTRTHCIKIAGQIHGNAESNQNQDCGDDDQ